MKKTKIFAAIVTIVSLFAAGCKEDTTPTPTPTDKSVKVVSGTLTGNVTGGTGLMYSWSGPVTGIVDATAVNTTIPSASLLNNGVFTLMVTAPGCTGNVSGVTTSQVVNALPTVQTFTGGGGFPPGLASSASQKR